MMGYLSEHLSAPSNAACARMYGTGDLLSLLATRRGDASVRVRLEAASPNWDGTICVDEADALTIVSLGLGSRV